ncbi:MAG TPA: putative metallopeptidase [Geobacteraceae bacterium]|nr:putative metallopeptidase [Geobacteraceae bacterium]
MATLNLTAELERLIADIVDRIDEFSHIDPRRILVCVSSTRSGGVHGTYAKIHPLRFENGSRTKSVGRGMRRHVYESPAITHRGVEMLYVVYFLIPRFLNLPFREKMITLFHELFHISPEFNGDIRRFPGRNYAHGSSTKRYNKCMARLVDAYLKADGDDHSAEFLKGDMAEIRQRYRSIVGRKMAAPRIRLVK